MNETVLGAMLVYGIPCAASVAFWLAIRHLNAYWEGRDVMKRLRPSRREVARTERALMKGFPWRS